MNLKDTKLYHLKTGGLLLNVRSILQNYELHCEKCDSPIFSLCVSSTEHEGHKLVDYTLKIFETKKVMQQQLKEFTKFIYPEYQKIASYITIQRDDLNKNSEKLITTINKHGENLHREIDTIMQKLKSDIDETDSINLALLKEQEDEITRTISVITQIIA